MGIRNVFLLCILFCTFSLFSNNTEISTKEDKKVHKFVLENGLIVLVVPVQHASQVAVQIWYNVGSKHEVVGERGMAHFIEHMIFKGTEEMLSESDINMIGDKLSAYTNAGTWYDFTLYYFTLPLANWDKVLPIFADCMQNCRFKQEHMDAEVKAVIQELKMGNDNYKRSLMLNMITTIFDSHPYHYTTIGFKQDLWNLRRDTLMNFYKKHYIPQNATLILVGNLDPKQALQQVKESFDHIPKGKDVKPSNFYINEDIQSKSVRLYRDVQQSIGCLAFVIPGLVQKVEILIEVLGVILANSKSSRLHKKLVDELGLVSNVEVDNIGTYDRELFQIRFTPKKEEDFNKIKEIILQEISDLVKNGFSDEELQRALKLVQVYKQHELEDVQTLAKNLGWSYLANGDENLIFTDLSNKQDWVQEQLMELLQKHFRASLCHDGCVCKVSDSDKKYLEYLQKQSAQSDGDVLAEKERDLTLEPGKYVHSVVSEKFVKKELAKPEILTLPNGLEVLLCPNHSVKTVECVLKLKADHFYDPDGYEGVSDLIAKMMLEGTKTYPGLIFAQESALHGLLFETFAGGITCSMLSHDVEKGLDFMRSMLQEATFDKKDFDRVKDKQKVDVKAFWDDPKQFMRQVSRELIYGEHPYSKPVLGTEKSLNKINRDYCFSFYKKYSSPRGARLVVTGDFNVELMKQMIQNAFAFWVGQDIEELSYPILKDQVSTTKNIEKNRDQVFMTFVGKSVDRLDPSYDALLVYEQILAGGSASSMDSLLFRLREQTGLFYAVIGSLLLGADKQPGMTFIATMVAKDRVQEAHEAFTKVLYNGMNDITDEEVERAKEVIVNTYVKKYETNQSRALVFHFLRKFDLPFDYFEKQVDKIRAISKDEVVRAAKKLLQKGKLSFVRIGKELEQNRQIKKVNSKSR